MKISAELSLYPLTEQFGTPILEFIEKLNSNPNIEIRRNTMSTQIFGDYETITDLLKNELKIAFETDETVVLVMKIVNKDLR